MSAVQPPTREQIPVLARLRAAVERDSPFGLSVLVMVSDLDAVLALFPQSTPSAEPVSIADMAPRTTFTASYGKDLSGTTRWMRCTGTSRCVNVGGVRFDAYAIDPSTIRDVTAPPATPEGTR